MPKPKPSPKRTNWKQLYRDSHRLSKRFFVQIGQLKAQVEQLVGDVKAVAQDYTDAMNKLAAAERRNAELLKEREARENHMSAVCGLADAAQSEVNRLNSLAKPSWLRRNWVELTVMAVVLGAIAFIVWRAWR